MDTSLRSATLAPATGGAQGPAAAGRAAAIRPAAPDKGAVALVAANPAPLKRSIDWNPDLQGEVARAQQALDYLERVAGQLEALKSDLSARLTGRGDPARRIEAQARQLAATLDARRAQGGGGIDAELGFNHGQPALQRFRIEGLDVASLQARAPANLGFSVGAQGGPQLAATIEPGMTAEEIAHRLDRSLAPVKLRAGLDEKRELVFATPEPEWEGVKDAIAVTGRGRAGTVEVPGSLAPQQWELGNPDALRQSLREVVQALARVRRSQEAASAALSAAMARTAQPEMPSAELAMIMDDFALTAASHDYESLLAITSALVGVSRERVQALLGLR
ncbi:hypothetical protein [Massilia niastensis]|uniref:hypothetical protein n=1 Tax=Massilia niastensis TaxID=544911 RepID=UPI0003629ED8|nr:hypothetical protein [Massilia niastensis]